MVGKRISRYRFANLPYIKTLFVFYSIKSLTKDPTDVGLTDKSIWINGFDDTENELTLLLAS